MKRFYLYLSSSISLMLLSFSALSQDVLATSKTTLSVNLKIIQLNISDKMKDNFKADDKESIALSDLYKKSGNADNFIRDLSENGEADLLLDKNIEEFEGLLFDSFLLGNSVNPNVRIPYNSDLNFVFKFNASIKSNGKVRLDTSLKRFEIATYVNGDQTLQLPRKGFTFTYLFYDEINSKESYVFEVVNTKNPKSEFNSQLVFIVTPTINKAD